MKMSFPSVRVRWGLFLGAAVACALPHGAAAGPPKIGVGKPIAPAVPAAPAPPTPRLEVTGGGATVYDTLGDTTWLADANLPATMKFNLPIGASGAMDYDIALRWVAKLNKAKHLGHEDWTLPPSAPVDKKCESHHRFDFGFGCVQSPLPALYGALGFRHPDTAVPFVGVKLKGFVNFQPYLYWSETVNPTHEDNEAGFSTFSFDNGFQGSNISKNFLYVIPMINGRFDPTDTIDKLRVVHDGDVTWLSDANLAATQRFGVAGIAPDGAMPHDVALKWIDALNKANLGRGLLGSKAWRLPPTVTPDKGCSSKKDTFGFGCAGSPLGRLYHGLLDKKPGESIGGAPDTAVGPFHNIRPYLYWSCHASETNRKACSDKKSDPVEGFGWSFSFGNGFQGTTTRDNLLYVTAVHPGR